jgi:DNA-binding Xre family transcriptional regulator
MSTAKKGRDIPRTRRLTADEAAACKKSRQEIMAEIPPARTSVVRQAVGKLRLLREEMGLSLADMEERTGMTRANLCRLENEARNVQLRTLERYARALGRRIEVHVLPVAARTESAKT